MYPLKRRQLLISALGTAAFSSRAAEGMQLAHLAPRSGGMAKDAGDIRLGLLAGLDELGPNLKRQLPLRQMEELDGPDGFVQQVSVLCKQAPTILLAPLGPVAIASLLGSGLLNTQDLLVINPIPGAESFRKPSHPKMLHVRASDSDQVTKIIQHARTIGIHRLALVTELDGSPAAESIWRTASKIAAESGGIEVRHVSIAAAAEVTDAIRKLPNAPQAVLSAGSPMFMAGTADAVRKMNAGMHTYTLSYLTSDVAFQLLGARARGIAIAQVFPATTKSHLPFVKTFHEAMKRSSPDLKNLNAYHMEGYAVARLVSHGMTRSKALSPTGLATALRASGRIDLGGYEVNFSESNEGSRYVDIGMIDGSGSIRS